MTFLRIVSWFMAWWLLLNMTFTGLLVVRGYLVRR